MFEFTENLDKKRRNQGWGKTVLKSDESSLESKLEYLKTMKDKGMITDEIYSNRVNDLLKESGF